MTDRPLEPGLEPGLVPGRVSGPVPDGAAADAGRSGAGPVSEGPGAQAVSIASARETGASGPAPAGAGAKGASGDDGRGPGGISLAARLRQPRTIISIVVPIVMLVLIFRVALNIDVGKLVHAVEVSNKLALIVAFVVFYLGFPLRGFRWVQLLKGAGFRLATDDGTEILFLSWTVNCLVPAKLGDVYRAYLLNSNSPASMSRTLGTVFIERILDIVVIAVLGIGAGFWSFRNGLPPEIEVVVAIGVVVAIVLVGALLTLRNFGRRALEKLPLPDRVLDIYDRFEAGVFQAVNRRALPGLVALTVLIWCTEGLRLFFVVQALGFPDVSLGLSGAFFVALIASLLTAVPLSPAGLGIVELGVVGVLATAYGVPLQEATTIALVDRAISVFSIIVIGSIAYLISGLPRGRGLRHPLPQEPGFQP